MSDNEFEVVVYFEKNKPSYAEVSLFLMMKMTT